MKTIDINGKEILSPILSLGYLRPERILIAHHAAIEKVDEVWHYETSATYPNGGKDLLKVIDVPGIAPVDAWDEYEDILRYIPYTPEELAEIEANRKPSTEEQIEELREALNLLLSGVTE